MMAAAGVIVLWCCKCRGQGGENTCFVRYAGLVLERLPPISSSYLVIPMRTAGRATQAAMGLTAEELGRRGM